MIRHICIALVVAYAAALGDVGALEASKLGSFVASADGGTALVEVYAPWCGHCKKLEPVLKQVQQTVAGKASIGQASFSARFHCDKTIPCARSLTHLGPSQIDGTASGNKAIVKALGVSSYPTIFIYRDVRFCFSQFRERPAPHPPRPRMPEFRGSVPDPPLGTAARGDSGRPRRAGAVPPWACSCRVALASRAFPAVPTASTRLALTKEAPALGRPCQAPRPTNRHPHAPTSPPPLLLSPLRATPTRLRRTPARATRRRSRRTC